MEMKKEKITKKRKNMSWNILSKSCRGLLTMYLFFHCLFGENSERDDKGIEPSFQVLFLLKFYI